MATPEEYGLKSFLEVYTITWEQANRLAYKAGWISSGDEIEDEKNSDCTLQIYNGIMDFAFFDTEEEREAKIKELSNKGAYIRGSLFDPSWLKATNTDNIEVLERKWRGKYTNCV